MVLNFRGNIAETFPDKPHVELSPSAVIVVSCVRNEGKRLPYFFEYYRAIGVDHFFIVDNNSSDNSATIIEQQPDATYFHTDESYRSAKSGRLWTSEIAAHYGNGRWVLTLDADEIFVYPGCEYLCIHDLTRYLDSFGFEGMFGFFLDMYPSGALKDAIYKLGTPFLRTASYFDGNGYRLDLSEKPPHLVLRGGPRERVFSFNRTGSSPEMQKHVLVKWSSGFSYASSTHAFVKPIKLADVTSAVLHFKFFGDFSSFVTAEIERGDRTQVGHYFKYQETLSEKGSDFSLMHETSLQYFGSADLLNKGYMAVSGNFVDWFQQKAGKAVSEAVLGFYPPELGQMYSCLRKAARKQKRACISNEGINIFDQDGFIKGEYVGKLFSMQFSDEDRVSQDYHSRTGHYRHQMPGSWSIYSCENAKNDDRMHITLERIKGELTIGIDLKYWKKGKLPRVLLVEQGPEIIMRLPFNRLGKRCRVASLTIEKNHEYPFVRIINLRFVRRRAREDHTCCCLLIGNLLSGRNVIYSNRVPNDSFIK